MTNEQQETSAIRKTYKLNLVGDGLSLEQEVDQAVAFQILAAVMGEVLVPQVSSSRPQSRAGKMVRSESNGGPDLTIGEFVEESGAKTIPDLIAATAVYLLEYRGADVVTRSDIQTQFQAARIPMPRNLPRDIGKAVSARYLEDRGGGIYAVTTTGMAAVEGKFSAATRRTSGVRRRGRRKASSERPIEQSAE